MFIYKLLTFCKSYIALYIHSKTEKMAQTEPILFKTNFFFFNYIAIHTNCIMLLRHSHLHNFKYSLNTKSFL